MKTVENFSRQLDRAFFREQKWVDSRERRGLFSSPNAGLSSAGCGTGNLLYNASVDGVRSALVEIDISVRVLDVNLLWGVTEW